MDYESKVNELINKSDITSLLNSYFRALDEKDFEVQRFAALFTTDAQVMRPDRSTMIGPETISASHKQSFTRFEGSQHMLTGHDISIEGDIATVRANLVAMHMWQGSSTIANRADNFFVAGGVVFAELVQEDGQWKIARLSNSVIWRAGGFKDMMQTGKPAG